MLSNQLDETLTDLDYDALYRMAEWHDKHATVLRSRAQRLQEDEHMNNKVAMRVQFLNDTPKTVMRYLKQGHSADQACKLASDHTGVPLKTIRTHWKRFLDDKNRKAVKQRNALALELHGLGLTNVNISDRLNLHPVTVSRILKREKEKRLYNPNPDRIMLFSGQEDRIEKIREKARKAA